MALREIAEGLMSMDVMDQIDAKAEEEAEAAALEAALEETPLPPEDL
jgi:hypothetical protein